MARLFAEPPAFVGGTCKSAREPAPGDIPVPPAMTRPFKMSSLPLSPVTEISPASSSVGRAPSRARSSSVTPFGRSIAMGLASG